MGTSRTKQLKKARKQVGSVVDQFDLDKRAIEVADRAGVVKRRTMLGIPLGRKHLDWSRIVKYGAAAAAGMMGSKALRRNGDSSRGVEAAAERGAERGAAKAAKRSESDSE